MRAGKMRKKREMKYCRPGLGRQGKQQERQKRKSCAPASGGTKVVVAGACEWLKIGDEAWNVGGAASQSSERCLLPDGVGTVLGGGR